MPFTGRKLAGLALIVGAPAFTIAEFVKSGGSMTATDLDQLASNPTLNHIMSEVSVLGLLLTLFGLYAFRRGAAHGGEGGALGGSLSRFGLLALTVGFVGFVISNGLDHITLHVLTHESAIRSDDSRLMALSIGTAKAGVVIVSASGVLFGTMLLALGLAMTLPAGFQRTAAQAMSALALAGLGVHIMAEHVHTDTLYAISGMSTVVVALWYVTLGVSIMRTKGEPEGTAYQAAGYST